MSKDKPETRGGARAGAGRKPKSRQHSEKTKSNYVKAAAKIAKETGMTVEEHYLRMSIDPDVQPAARAAFAKLYNEAMIVKESEQTIKTTQQGPMIGLPPVMTRPQQKEEEENRALH